jgi:hypothetical protein
MVRLLAYSAQPLSSQRHIVLVFDGTMFAPVSTAVPYQRHAVQSEICELPETEAIATSTQEQSGVLLLFRENQADIKVLCLAWQRPSRNRGGRHSINEVG